MLFLLFRINVESSQIDYICGIPKLNEMHRLQKGRRYDSPKLGIFTTVIEKSTPTRRSSISNTVIFTAALRLRAEWLKEAITLVVPVRDLGFYATAIITTTLIIQG